MNSIIRRFIVTAIIIALMFSLSGCSLLAGVGGTSAETDDAPITGYITKDGDCWFPARNKTNSIHIEGNIQQAILCGNRKDIIILESSGLLYITSPSDLMEQTEVTKHAKSVVDVRNDGFIYRSATDIAGSYYRYSFSTGASIKIDSSLYAVADDSISILYSNSDGTVNILPSTSSSATEIGQYIGTFAPVCVNNAGTIGVWSITNSDVCSVFLYNSGERERLDQVDADYNYTYASFSGDNNSLIVVNTNSPIVFIKNNGEDTIKIELPSNINSSLFYTEDDQFQYSDKINANSSIYLSAETDDYGYSDLYCVNLSGDRERVLSNVRECVVKNGHLYYTNEDYSLFSCTIKEADLSKEEKVSANVYTIQASPNGDSICYGKNIGEDEVGALYYYSSKTNESSRITTDARFIYYELSSINSYIAYDYSVFSDDGRYLYYFKDTTSIADTYQDYGTLCQYRVDEDMSDTLLNDAMTFISTGVKNGYVDSDFFWGIQFVSYNNSQLLTDLYAFVKGEKVGLSQNILSPY